MRGLCHVSLSRLSHQGPACEVHPDMMVAVAICHLCLPCGHSPTGESQKRGRAGLWVNARSISQRESLLAPEASWTINRDKLNCRHLLHDVLVQLVLAGT